MQIYSKISKFVCLPVDSINSLLSTLRHDIKWCLQRNVTILNNNNNSIIEILAKFMVLILQRKSSVLHTLLWEYPFGKDYAIDHHDTSSFSMSTTNETSGSKSTQLTSSLSIHNHSSVYRNDAFQSHILSSMGDDEVDILSFCKSEGMM